MTVEVAYADGLAFAPVEVHQPADEPAELDRSMLDWLLSEAPYGFGEKPERVLVATDDDEVEINSRVPDALKLVSQRSSRLLSTLLS